MKTNKNNKQLGLSNSKETILTIIMSLALLLGLVTIGILYINRATNKKYSKNIEETIDIWEESFKKVENTKVGLEFNSIGTSIKEYEALQNKCKEYIPDINNSDDLDATVQTEVVITEKEFIDNNKNQSDDTNTIDDKLLVETGPIYFNNLYLVRYIDEYGNLAVLCSAFTDEDKDIDNIKVYKQSELKEALEILNEFDINNQYVSNNPNVINEEDYINDIYERVISILVCSKRDLNDSINNILPYFTLSGKDSIVMIKNELGLDNNYQTEFILALAGKSNLDKASKDRIYMQILCSNKKEEKTVNMVIKLNSNLRIFDIDLL